MAKLMQPRFEDSGPIHAIGLRAHYECGGNPAIAAQWQKLGEMMPRLPAQKRPVAYGICFDRDNGLDYVAAIDVDEAASAQGEASKVSLPAQRYAVFAHDGAVDTLVQTCAAIFRDWAPQAGVELAKQADGTQIFVERYGPGFDYRTGRGDIEVWIPIE